MLVNALVGVGDRVVRPTGAFSAGTLTEREFKRIQDAWKIVDRKYDAFWDRFNRQNLKRRQRLRDIADWHPRNLTEQETLWQQMSRDIKASIYVNVILVRLVL